MNYHINFDKILDYTYHSIVYLLKMVISKV